MISKNPIFDDIAGVSTTLTSGLTSLDNNMSSVGVDGSQHTVFIFAALLCVYFSCGFVSVSGEELSITASAGFQGPISLTPTVEFLGPLRTLVMWQLPPQGPVRKVLVILPARIDQEFLAPGLFWDPSSSCPLCTGLPENRKITTDALSRNYAVIVVTSLTAQDGGDWTTEAWPQDSPDLNNAAMIISEWKRTHGLHEVPTVGLGMSAGGQAISSLALRPGFFESLTIMISAGREEAWLAATPQYPPTLFVNMPKDEATAVSIKVSRGLLQLQGVITKQVKWYEQPITPDWFAQLIPGLTMSTSCGLFSALKEESWLDENNFLKYAFFDWQSMAKSRNLLPDDRSTGKLMFEDSITQELKVAFAMHVTLSRENDHIYAWFDGDDSIHGTLTTY